MEKGAMGGRCKGLNGEGKRERGGDGEEEKGQEEGRFHG